MSSHAKFLKDISTFNLFIFEVKAKESPQTTRNGKGEL